MRTYKIRQPVCLFFLLLLTASHAALAAGPPCRPCAGVRVDDPSSLTAALSAEPRVEGEARLYVAWPAELDGSADASGFETVRSLGGTPWMTVTFRTPRPVREHGDELATELEDLARLARGAGERAHFQIRWQPEDGGFEVTDFAFLLKRAAVAVTGARPDARVLAGPLSAGAELLRTLYGEEVAAYLDGVVFAPGDGLAEALAVLAELDPGKPAVLDALGWPEEDARTLSLAAEYAEAGFGVTFFALDSPEDADLAPLKLLAREFQGDLSLDPTTRPQGSDRAWTFVRGEDLSLRVVAEATPGQRLSLIFDDPQLKSPASIDLADGSDSPVYGQFRTRSGLGVPIDDPGAVVLLRVERMTAAELEGLEERVEVEDQRQMPVEEILRRLQAFEDDQARRVDHYQARNILHLRFQSGTGGIEAAYEGDFFFRRGEGFDWVWETFYVDGVKWKGKKLPELPLIQPEKAAALPLEIHLSKEYAYNLRGTDEVDGRDCWVVDFRPLAAAPGRGLYQGTVWVDREVYARVRTRALQLGLEGDVISNEETVTFTPVDQNGQPAPWSSDSFVLPTRVVGQQLLSVLNATVAVEKETELTSLRINGDDFGRLREEARDSELTMVRDTDQGLRYLRKDDEGNRYVEEGVDTDRLFLAAGVFWDESVAFPIPLGGINYLALDFKGSGNQLNVFFAGALLTVNVAEPRLFGSRWDAGANVFGFFVPRGDELFRGDSEVPEEEIESTSASASLFVGRPLGSFTKLDFTYRLGWSNYGRADDTADDFVLPRDTLTHTFETELKYNRGGYRFALLGSVNRRDDWQLWGLPGNTEFDPDQEEYVRWQATLAKTWWLQKFRNFGVQLRYLDGSDLDRFSRYDFGIFGDASVAGYQSGLVRADQAKGLHMNYGINVADLFRVEVEGDAVWATNDETGLKDELLAGVGLEGTLTLPWQVITNFEVGVAVEGPGKGDVALRIVFLKLFSGKGKKHRAAADD
jgi:hypothetical protein